jgi:hypothetical protein
LLSGGAVTVAQTDKELRVTVAEKDSPPVDTVVKLELDGPAMEIPPIVTPQAATLTPTPAKKT